jgi:hypothetical protein
MYLKVRTKGKSYLVVVPDYSEGVYSGSYDFAPTASTPPTGSPTGSSTGSISSLEFVASTGYGTGQLFDYNRSYYAGITSGSHILMFSDLANLYALDVTDPNNVIQVATVAWPSTVSGLIGSGSYVYGISSDADVYVVNIHNVFAGISINNTIPTPASGEIGPGQWARIQDGLLIFTGPNPGLSGPGSTLLYDLSNPESPSLLSRIQPPDETGSASPVGGGGDAIKYGNYLFVCEYFSLYQFGLAFFDVWNIANPSSPSFVTRVPVVDGTDATFETWTMQLYGNTLYIYDDYVIQSWDISDPTNPQYVTSTYGGSDTEGPIITNGLMFNMISFDALLQAYTLTDPKNPSLQFSLDLTLYSGNGYGSHLCDDDPRGYLYGNIDGILCIFQYQP